MICQRLIQKQGHALVKARGFLGSVCVWLTSLLWCFDMCYWRPLFLARPATNLVSKFWPVPLWSSHFLASGSARPKHRGFGMCALCTEAVHSMHFEHELHYRFGHVCTMYRSSPFRSTLNTSYIRFGHVCTMYRSSPFRSTLNTGYIGFGHVCTMYRSSPFRSTLNTSYSRFGHVCTMYRSSPFRSTLNTGYITGLDMCALCTEAVHSVPLWTRVTLGLDMCALCTEAVHSVALWTRVTLQVWTCVHYVPKQSIP